MVVVLKTKQILLSNHDGKVAFILNGASNIQVSEKNYENLTLRWASLKENEFVIQEEELTDVKYISLENSKKLTDEERKDFVRTFSKEILNEMIEKLENKLEELKEE